ncbi:MAG: peptidase M48, partial [Comamonadaceae bacterium]|nr:peptidase M48 [Comamonadaceae bacterium]
MCLLCDLKTAQAAGSAPRPGHAWSSRRAFVLAGAAAAVSAALPAAAQVDVGKSSSLRKLVPADQLEAAASQQYVQVMQEAQGKQVLLPTSHPQVQRLQTIARRIIPHTPAWNPR